MMNIMMMKARAERKERRARVSTNFSFYSGNHGILSSPIHSGSKKNIDKKLKHSSDAYDDDWWTSHDEEDMDAFDSMSDVPTVAPMISGESSVFPSSSASPSASSSPSIEASSSPSQNTISVQQALLRAEEQGGHVGITTPMEYTAPPRADVVTLRLSDSDVARQSNSAGTGPQFGVPSVERELFPDPVFLKAHSSVYLQQYDGELFAETTEFLTPCLERAYPEHLQAYKLSVDYNEGPDVSDVGLIITHMNIQVVLSVLTDSITELRSMTHEGATEALRTCFDGPQLYQYLGALRMGDVEINEIAFLEDDFRAPVFANNQPISASVESNGQPSGTSNIDTEPKKSRAGLVISLCFGMVAVGAVAFAHQQGKLSGADFSTDRLKRTGSALRNKIKNLNIRKRAKEATESVQENMSHSFGSSGDAGSTSDGSKSRERSWSGSFRRHPEGGVRPAALSKKGAKSSDYIKSPSMGDEYSFSVGDDYNVPVEYDFQATPVSTMYQGKPAVGQQESPITVDEFSMPEDYNTVNEEISLYSRNMSIAAGYTSSSNAGYTSSSKSSGPSQTIRRPVVPRRDSASATSSSLPEPTPASSAASSPKNKYADEWSYNSYATSSPAATSREASEDGSTPSYRHWESSPKDSPGTRLAMPRLS